MSNSSFIRFTVAPCFLGHLLLAATDKGICAASLSTPGIDNSPQTLETQLRQQFPAARLERHDAALNDAPLQVWMDMLLEHLEGRQPALDLPLDVAATPFQQSVWQALRDIPYGETRTYTQIAQTIKQPGAVRAVGGACAANRVALVVPCHRVVREGGIISGYRWGSEKKRLLLQREAEYSGKARALFSMLL